MKLKVLLLLAAILLLSDVYGQRKEEKSIFSASSLNYYPELASYSFFRTLETEQDQLILNYVTATSGKFTIEEGVSQQIENENINKFPSQLLNIGASVQIRNANSTFHEISISRLANSKSSYLNQYTYSDSLGYSQSITLGYRQKSFVLSLRYGYGKLFGKDRNNIRFGLLGILEPNLYTYKREVFSSQEFPIKATVFTLNLALGPIMSCKLSKRVFLDFQILPRVLIADYGKVTIGNPILPADQQKATREYNLPEIDLAGTFQVRYLLKEPKRRGRK